MARNKLSRARRIDPASRLAGNHPVLSKAVWIIFFILIAVGGIAYLGDAMYKSDLFKIKYIHSNIELKAELKNSISGVSLFKLDTNKILRAITSEHPEYKEVHVIKEFPFSVRIMAAKRFARAQIKGENFYFIDKDGVVLDDGSEQPRENLVSIEIVDFNRRLRRGERIKDERLKYAFEFIKVLEKEGFLEDFKIKSVNATSLPVLYFIANGAKIIIGNEDFSKRLYVLKNLIEKQLKNDLSSVDYIDLRYNKVYVGYRR